MKKIAVLLLALCCMVVLAGCETDPVTMDPSGSQILPMPTTKETDPVHVHKWEEAACTAPKICSSCGATEGEPVGHTWQDATCTEPMTCDTCGATEDDAKGHYWQESTCTEPMTCTVCGTTEGTAKDHDWANSTCTEPKTCKTCSVTEGNARGHDWQLASCSTPKTCRSCGLTDGSEKGHALSDWSIIEAATCTTVGKIERSCSLCSYTEYQDTAQTEHVWSDWLVVTEPTMTSFGLQFRECKLCRAVEDHLIDKLTSPVYSPFEKVLNTYIVENVPFHVHEEELWAAQITYYTTEKDVHIAEEIVTAFESAFGYTPTRTVQITSLGKYYIDGVDGVTVYKYEIWDNSVPLCDNPMYTVYEDICTDGSPWIGFCIYGSTFEEYEAFAATNEFYALYLEMLTRFEAATGHTLSYMREHPDQYATPYLSFAGKTRTSDGQIRNVIFVYCRVLKQTSP